MSKPLRKRKPPDAHIRHTVYVTAAHRKLLRSLVHRQQLGPPEKGRRTFGSLLRYYLARYRGVLRDAEITHGSGNDGALYRLNVMLTMALVDELREIAHANSEQHDGAFVSTSDVIRYLLDQDLR